MFSVQTSVEINRSAVERILRLPGGLVEQNMRRRMRRVEARTRQLAPGTMSSQITSRITREDGEITAFVISNHPATIYVISGTRPHIIRPVRAQALRFTVGGRVVFAKIVHHPGTRANNFLLQALREAL